MKARAVEQRVPAMQRDTMRGRRWQAWGAGWREDAGFLLFHFPTWAKARALQNWIDRSGIAHRPMPTAFSGPQLGIGSGAEAAGG